MCEVTVNLLGGFGAAVDGIEVPPTAWRLKKARELVKLLALAPGHRLHREQAMDVLWRDRAPAAAANNLHQAVHVARRALAAEAIELRDEVLVLAADVDVDRFELAASHARRVETPAAYRSALALYAGPLLPENRYDDWAETRRDDLAALAAALEDEGAALGSRRAFELPGDASSFVGRGQELSELGALLRRTRLLTLSGTGGAGKTRLALELARGVEQSYDGGAALVELGALTDARLVSDAVASALDVRALPSQELVDAVVDFLSPRRLLLVLDNCEHLLASTAALADILLRLAPQLTIIATSREPLRVPGEIVFRVPSLDIPNPEHALTLDELRAYEAVSLFTERAEAAAPNFRLDKDNAEDVARICFRLDGLPLALELAAGRVGALSTAAIAERLDDRFRLLRTGSSAAPTRQQTLTATLQWSHDLLEPEEQVLFRRLAIFAGGFELAAAEEVCAVDGLVEPEIADLLGRLAEKSLVAVEDSGEGKRYRLLETVRMYARERLLQSGEELPTEDRHARWALVLAERELGSARLDRESPNLRAALTALLAREPHDALRLSVALLPFWLRRIDLAEARRRLAEALAASPERTSLGANGWLAAAAIHFRSGTLADGLPLAEQSLAVASEIGDVQSEWRALQFLGELGLASDDAEVAVAWLERALELARSKKLAAGEAISIHSLGVAACVVGDLGRAEELVAESIAAFRALEFSEETIHSPLNIAEIRVSQPDGRPGLRHLFEDTLQPFAVISCAAGVSYALANQAAVARMRGDLSSARALLDESEQRFAAARDDAGLATVAVRRAYTSLAEEDLAAAHLHLERALDLRAGLSDRRGRALVLSGLGLVETIAGDYEDAECDLAEALEIFRRAGDRWGLASTLWRTADLAIARGRLDDAESALHEALSVLAPTQRERWIASTLAELAELSVLRGDLERARKLLSEARERYAARADALGTASVDGRLIAIAPAKAPLRPDEETAAITSGKATKGRKR